MENSDKILEFKIINIKTEQFALFEENHLDKGEINLDTNLSYGLNATERNLIVSIKFTFGRRKSHL